MSNTSTADSYRLKPTVRNTVFIIIGYLLALMGFGKIFASGIEYNQITASSDSLLKAALIPVALTSVLLTCFSIWTGWWKEIWKKNKIAGHKWLVIIPVFIFIGLTLGIYGGDVSKFDSTFVLYAIIATLFIGYSEELLVRGMTVFGMRESGWNEARIMVGSSFLFGIAHFTNIIGGQDLKTTMAQVAATVVIGMMFYVTMRSTGYIVISMILHSMWDFSVMVSKYGGEFSDSLKIDTSLMSRPSKIGMLFQSIAQLATVIAVILLVRQSRKVSHKSAKEPAA